jgi:hypothetical protein
MMRNMRSIFDVLINANEEGYSSVNIVVGSDRQAEFENLAQKYNGDLYNFDLIRVVSAGVRDADADGVEGMSASKMRKAVLMMILIPSAEEHQRHLMILILKHSLMLFVREWVQRKRKKKL